MMKLYATLLILFFPLALVFAQSKWSFGLGVQGGFSGYKSNYFEEHPSSSTSFNLNFEYGYTEKRQPGVGVGMWWRYHINPRWSLDGGIDYQRSQAYINHFFNTHMPNGTPVEFSSDVYRMVQNQLQFPLLFSYHFKNKKERQFVPFASLGLQLRFLKKQNHTVESTTIRGLEDKSLLVQEQDIELKGLNRLQTAAHAALGLHNNYVSISIRTTYPLRHELINDKAARRRYICCFRAEDPSSFIQPGTLLLLQQTALVFQYRIF